MPRGILFVGVGLAAANMPAPAPAPAPQPASASHHDGLCTELCSHRQGDEGIGRSMQQCLTQCAIRMDTAAPQEKQDAARRFVEDHAVNEKGGQNMKNAYHKTFGEKIPGCKPVVDIDSSPNFNDIDENWDGQITEQEAVSYGVNMCIPPGMTMQIFRAADVAPCDRKLSLSEFGKSGEDSLAAKVIDRGADGATEGDNEYHETTLPDFEVWDNNKDGFLQKEEAFQAFMHELKRRNVAYHGTVTSGSGAQKVQDNMWHGIYDTIFPEMDMNRDGKISRREFYGPALGSDFGEELREYALADEDAPDPDGPRYVPLPKIPAAQQADESRSLEKDHKSLQKLEGAMEGLVDHEDAVALSKMVLPVNHMVDEAIHLHKEAARHKHRSKFAHVKMI